jgi:hypothetical protein
MTNKTATLFQEIESEPYTDISVNDQTWLKIQILAIADCYKKLSSVPSVTGNRGKVDALVKKVNQVSTDGKGQNTQFTTLVNALNHFVEDTDFTKIEKEKDGHHSSRMVIVLLKNIIDYYGAYGELQSNRSLNKIEAFGIDNKNAARYNEKGFGYKVPTGRIAKPDSVEDTTPKPNNIPTPKPKPKP